MPQTTGPRPVFNKRERLCSRSSIERLFGSGSRSLSAYPLRAVWRYAPGGSTEAALLISVSKRHFRHAVDRNRIKRLVREAYRLNKTILTDAVTARNNSTDEAQTVHLALIWLSDDLPSASVVTGKVKNLLCRISEHL